MSERPFTPEELATFTQNPDLENLKQNDRKIMVGLLIMAYQGHRSSMEVCLSYCQLKFDEDVLLESQETARIIIEEVLVPDLFESTAVAGLKASIDRGETDSPLWFYLARSYYSKSSDFRELVISQFQKDTAFFTEVMEKAGQISFLSTIEDELKKLAPFVKFLPLQEDSHEHVPSHDKWLRIGSAYVRLWKLTQSTPPELPSVLEFLKSRFFPLVPESMDEWMASVPNEVKRIFQAECQIYSSLFKN